MVSEHAMNRGSRSTVNRCRALSPDEGEGFDQPSDEGVDVAFGGRQRSLDDSHSEHGALPLERSSTALEACVAQATKEGGSVLEGEARNHSSSPGFVVFKVRRKGQFVVTEEPSPPEDLHGGMHAGSRAAEAPGKFGLAAWYTVLSDGSNDGALHQGKTDWKAFCGALERSAALEEMDALGRAGKVAGATVDGQHGQTFGALKDVKVMPQGTVGRTKRLLEFAVAQPRVRLEGAEDSTTERVPCVIDRLASGDTADGQPQSSSSHEGATAKAGQASSPHGKPSGQPGPLPDPLFEQGHTANERRFLSEGSLFLRA